MNKQEFNEKWSAHLEDGHYGLALSLPSAIAHLDREFTRLSQAYPAFTYSQIKSKFNWFCFYAEGIPTAEVLTVEKELARLYSEIDSE